MHRPAQMRMRACILFGLAALPKGERFMAHEHELRYQ
jgi:hypothetical protein